MPASRERPSSNTAQHLCGWSQLSLDQQRQVCPTWQTQSATKPSVNRPQGHKKGGTRVEG